MKIFGLGFPAILNARLLPPGPPGDGEGDEGLEDGVPAWRIADCLS